MNRYFDNADLVLRMTLVLGVIICRLLGLISGPFANILAGIAVLIILLVVGRVLFTLIILD
jgi:hypothetical protein